MSRRLLLAFLFNQILSVLSAPAPGGDSDVNGGAGAAANLMNPGGNAPEISDPSGAAGGINSGGAMGLNNDPMGAAGGANPADGNQPMKS